MHVKNVTGAGDSFVAGLGYAYLNDLNIHDAVQFAMAMSLISIEDHRTINPSLTLQYVKDTIEKTNWFNIEY